MLGRGLVSIGFIIVLVSIVAVQSLNRNEDQRGRQLVTSLEILVADLTRDHLAPWVQVIMVMNSDLKQACVDAKSFPSSNSFFAFDISGVQICGPVTARSKLIDERWVALGDGYLTYSKISFTGSVVGVRVPINSILPKLRESGGFTAHLVLGEEIVASSPALSHQLGGDMSILSDLEVIQAIPNTDISIAFDKRQSQGLTLLALNLVRPVGILVLVGGMVIRFRGPWVYWWRSRGAPDGVGLFVFNIKGRALQWGGPNHPHPADAEIVRASQQKSAAIIQSLISRARNGEVGATELFVDDDATYRYLVVVWSNTLRRGVMLVSKPYTDPFSKLGAVSGNSSTATLLDPDGLIRHIHAPHLRLLNIEGNPHGVSLVSLFPRNAREKFETLRQSAIDHTGRVFNLVLPQGWRSLRVFVLADDRGACFVWFSDATEARQCKTLKAFVRDCVNYIENPVGRRPIMSTYRTLLDPDGMTVDPSHTATHRTLDNGQEMVELVNNLDKLLTLVETVKFGSESPAAQRFRAARRREVARIMHDTVIQDLVVLYWKLQTGGAGTLELTEQLITRVRGIVAKLRIPPWETQMQSIIRSFLQPVEDRGVAVSVHSALEEPLDKPILAAIAIVAKESVNNALKHADPAEIGVDVRTRNCKVVLTVSDSGSRSTVLHDSKLMELMNQGSTKSPVYSGNFGFKQCQEIAADLHGEFRFESQAGGHIAILTIPLAEPLQPAIETTGFEREFDFMYLDDKGN